MECINTISIIYYFYTMKDNRNSVIVVRLSAQEKRSIKLSALMQDMTVSDMIRRNLLKNK